MSRTYGAAGELIAKYPGRLLHKQLVLLPVLVLVPVGILVKRFTYSYYTMIGEMFHPMHASMRSDSCDKYEYKHVNRVS